MPNNCKQSFTFFVIHPPRIKGRAKNWTGDQFWRWTGRARMDGRQFFGDFKGKTLVKSGKIPRKKIGVGGRARPKYRPSFYTGGGVKLYNIFNMKICDTLFDSIFSH